MCLWIESVESGSRPLSRRLSCQRGQMPPRKLDNHQTHTTGVLAARDLAFLHHRLVTITFNFTRCVSHSTASHPPETDTPSFASFLRRRHDLTTAIHRQDLVSVDHRSAFVIHSISTLNRHICRLLPVQHFPIRRINRSARQPRSLYSARLVYPRSSHVVRSHLAPRAQQFETACCVSHTHPRGTRVKIRAVQDGHPPIPLSHSLC